MKLHKEAYPTVFYATLIFAFLNIGVWRMFTTTPVVYKSFLLLSLIVLAIVFYFFRVHTNVPPVGDNVVVSPAYGKVVMIEKVFENEFYKKEMLCVSIFMSPLNIHCNYVPISGDVLYSNHMPGKYLVAWHPKSSILNEHSSTAIKNDKIELLTKQIAGFMARRIVPYLEEGMQVNQNDELGFIKFGSRVDVFFPLNTNLLVQLGDKTKGGITALAKY